MNASSLKLLAVSPKSFKREKKEEEKKHLNLGKAVDSWLCFGKENFIKEFFIPTSEPPTGMLYTYAKFITEGIDPHKAYDMAGYKPSTIKRETVEKNLKNFENWMEEAANNKDKTMIAPKDFMLVQSRVEEVMTNPYSKRIFQDFSVQVPLYWEEIMGNSFIPCKALPDVIQEYDDKIVITDIKTVGEGLQAFQKSILKYRYDLQASWYCHAVEQCYGKKAEFQFLVIDLSEYRESSITYKLSETVIKNSKEGFTARNGFRYKGWQELLNSYYWHLVNNKWDYSEEVYRNEGTLTIDIL